MTGFLREPVVAVRLKQPLCSRTFGVAPCLATGDKCFNTTVTCKYRAALDMTATLDQWFVMDEAHPWVDTPDAFQPALAMAALQSVDTAPTVLNVASGSKDASPLGLRAVCQTRIRDFPWNDVGTDPYVATRPYVPDQQGSYWSKWLARNPYHVGYEIETYEGYRGDALAAMVKRQFNVEKIDAGRDGVSITSKDILRKITDTGVTAPALSPGALASPILAAATSLTIAGAVLADYPAAGLIRIDSEIISYSARSGTSNITFTGLLRGLLNTVPADHSQNVRVQRVLAYENMRCDAILYDLTTVWGLIAPAKVNLAAWTAEADEWRPEFIFTAYITEPTLVDDLMGEVCLQSLLNLWWDERLQLIELRAQRPEAVVPLISDDADISAKSFSIAEKPQERASQIHVYYQPRSWTAAVADKFNYERAAVFVDVNKQIDYGGEPAVRELFCRFIKTDAIAGNLAATYLGRFADVRREITFDLTVEDTFWTGNSVKISHFLDVDFYGAPKQNLWMITSAQSIEPGARYRFTAEDNGMVGVLWAWVDDAIPEWASASAVQKATIGYWTNDNDTDLDGNPSPFRWL